MTNFNRVLSTGLFILAGCSSAPPKADISVNANPQEEIAHFSRDLAAAEAQHSDVLAYEDIQDARGWLAEANQDLAADQKQVEVLDDVRKGRGYLNRASRLTAERSKSVQGILDARQSALSAGASNFPKTRESLAGYDRNLRNESKSLARLDSEDMSKMQSNYMGLELTAIQETQLGNARAILSGSITSKAKKLAPDSLKRAEMDMKNAENIILANRREKEKFMPAVAQANTSVIFLENVMSTIKSHKGLSEASAAEMVRSASQIAGLKSEIKIVEDNSKIEMKEMQSAMNTAKTESNKEITLLRTDLSKADVVAMEQGQRLAEAHKVISIQDAIESARNEFSDVEAEVFQQGDKLVVRLKTMQFTSGHAELPVASLALLAKVKKVAESLDPSEVVVEGHTDSVGTSAKNKTLSEERAVTVASYLSNNGLDERKIQSRGFGFGKPIATNKTSAGRAQNRRVDVVITPSTADKKSIL